MKRARSLETLLRLGGAGLMVALLTALLLWQRDELNTPVAALLYLLLVILSTASGGFLPGAAASILSFLAFNYYFIEPRHSLWVHRTQDLLALGVFLLVAGLTSQLMARARDGQALARAREREAVWLHEISAALANVHDSRAIVQILAEQCQPIFQAAQVQINLEAGYGAEPLTLRLPPEAKVSSQAPALIVPLQTAHSLLGEICLWREEEPFQPAEERLLQTFAAQGVLALERTQLAQAETRARVLEESDVLKTALLNSVSHELRTPLATIKASVSSLRSGAVDWESGAREELLAAIEEETDALNQLVGNLLNMSRIEAGVLRPQKSQNVLAEAAGSVIARLKRHPLRCEIRNEIGEDLPLAAFDYGLIEQVFANLLGNSLKYAPPGSVIYIRAQADETAARVQMINQGPPLPEEDLQRVFDRFYRASPDERVTGTGLGLSICKGIVEAHGGRIWAENLPGGVAFNFTLPLR